MSRKLPPTIKFLRRVATCATACAIFFILSHLISPALAAQTAPVELPVQPGDSFTATHPCVYASLTGTSFSTALGKCSAPAAEAASTEHFEADLRDGSFALHHTDLVPFDFSAVPLVRSYISRGSAFVDVLSGSGQPLAFGLNTISSYDGMPVQSKFVEHRGSRTVQEVSSPRGGVVRLVFDAHSRILEADDPHENTTRYFYNTDGVLAYTFDTAGVVRHYVYAGTLMTLIEDGKRRALVHNSYASGHLSAQTFANGDVYSYNYAWLPGSTSARRVTVTLPDHTEKLVSLTNSDTSSLNAQ